MVVGLGWQQPGYSIEMDVCVVHLTNRAPSAAQCPRFNGLSLRAASAPTMADPLHRKAAEAARGQGPASRRHGPRTGRLHRLPTFEVASAGGEGGRCLVAPGKTFPQISGVRHHVGAALRPRKPATAGLAWSNSGGTAASFATPGRAHVREAPHSPPSSDEPVTRAARSLGFHRTAPAAKSPRYRTISPRNRYSALPHLETSPNSGLTTQNSPILDYCVCNPAISDGFTICTMVPSGAVCYVR